MGKNPAGWGDFFRLWSRLWLEDMGLNDEEQAWYIRLLCAGHEVDWQRARFQVADIPLSKPQICSKAKITEAQFDRLVSAGKVEVLKTADKTAQDLFIIKNWEKYQNKERLHRYHLKTAGIPAGNTPEKEDVRCKIEKEDANNGGDKSPLNVKGFNGSNLTEEQYAQKYKTAYKRIKDLEEAKKLEDESF